MAKAALEALPPRLIGADCVLGSGLVVNGEGSSIKKSVVGSNCKIGAGVKIVNCVLMDGTRTQIQFYPAASASLWVQCVVPLSACFWRALCRCDHRGWQCLIRGARGMWGTHWGKVRAEGWDCSRSALPCEPRDGSQERAFE
jgi:hypothetical protein